MMNMQSTVAGMIRKSAADVTKAAQDLGDKMEWRPLDKGRSALDQVQETATIATIMLGIMEAQSIAPTMMDDFQAIRADLSTAEKTMEKYAESSEKLAQLVETATPEALSKIVTLPFGGGMTKTLGEVAMMVYWNNTYHEGQINYIQTLCAE